MSRQKEIIKCFQQLNLELLQEEYQKLPVYPEHGPLQTPEQQLQRLSFAFSFYLKPLLSQLIQWVQCSRENSNFTYHLTEVNLAHLAGWVSQISSCSLHQASQWINELYLDNSLRNYLNVVISTTDSAICTDFNMDYGRRLGWYALVRALKPRVVVETGVDKGLGSCVLTAALIRNQAEGYPGRYYGTDINHKSGWLFQKPYCEIGKILYGDSIECLKGLDESIDLFINDSDHSAEYEEREYACIEAKLSPVAVVLGDNSHVTNKLYQFARTTGRNFLFFSEKPAHHWYPGAGIGAAWSARKQLIVKF